MTTRYLIFLCETAVYGALNQNLVNKHGCDVRFVLDEAKQF